MLSLLSQQLFSRGSLALGCAASAVVIYNQSQANEQLRRTLSGKRALVTGSTSGIGQAIAEEFCAQGCDVVLNGFGQPQEIEDLRRNLEYIHGVKVLYMNHDLSSAANIKQMMQEIDSQLGGLDIVVNNAGVQFVAPVEEFPAHRWDQIIAVNLSSAFHTTSHVVEKMKQQGFGRIINIASAHGIVASPNKTAYVASKHGLVGLSKTIALETAGTGVTCNTICPGWVLTPLVEKQIEQRAAASGNSVTIEKVQLCQEKMPTKDFIAPSHIAKLAVFLCSDAASQITGAQHSIDGGWTAR